MPKRDGSTNVPAPVTSAKADPLSLSYIKFVHNNFLSEDI